MFVHVCVSLRVYVCESMCVCARACVYDSPSLPVISRCCIHELSSFLCQMSIVQMFKYKIFGWKVEIISTKVSINEYKHMTLN